jgi:hypothetical protein
MTTEEIVTSPTTEVMIETKSETVSATSTFTKLITSLSVSKTTDVITTTAITTFTPSPSPNCDFCKVEIHGTELVYPYIIVTTTVFATTIDVYTTLLPDGSSIVDSVTTTATPGCSPPSTWVDFGVVL